MGILDDLQYRPRLYPCKIREIAATLEPADRKKFLEAVEGNVWKIEALATELTKRGLPVSKPTILKHREKACSCSKI